MKSKTNIAYLCVEPNWDQMVFLSTMTEYHNVYIIVDNNSNIQLFQKNFNNLVFVYIEDELCKKNHFIKSAVTVPKLITSWDRALYYFSVVHNKIDEHTWFIEDDVFIPSSTAVTGIDLKYTNYDYLSNYLFVEQDLTKWMWGHPRLNNKFREIFPLPWCRSLVCAVRLSGKLLQLTKQFIEENQGTVFIECLFSTIAFHNNLNFATEVSELNMFPPERRQIEKEDITSKNISTKFKMHKLYHPLKSIEAHTNFRKMLNSGF